VLQKDRQFRSPPFFLVEQGLPILLEHTSSPPFFLVEQELPILLEHTSSPPFFLVEQELPILKNGGELVCSRRKFVLP
jgi:hypothetical protein